MTIRVYKTLPALRCMTGLVVKSLCSLSVTKMGGIEHMSLYMVSVWPGVRGSAFTTQYHVLTIT